MNYFPSQSFLEVVKRSNGLRFVTEVDPACARKAIAQALARCECAMARAKLAAGRVNKIFRQKG